MWHKKGMGQEGSPSVISYFVVRTLQMFRTKPVRNSKPNNLLQDSRHWFARCMCAAFFIATVSCSVHSFLYIFQRLVTFYLEMVTVFHHCVEMKVSERTCSNTAKITRMKHRLFSRGQKSQLTVKRKITLTILTINNGAVNKKYRTKRKPKCKGSKNFTINQNFKWLSYDQE